MGKSAGMAARVLSLAGLIDLAALTVSGQSKYGRIGPGGCGVDQNNCHARENAWWSGDAHYASLDDLYSNPNSAAYATRYGIAPGDLYKGTSDCMRCHATAVAGRESKDCEDGVACESCHGAGSGYKDPHQEKDGKTGAERSGYRKAVTAGMNDLRDLSTRAAMCVGCHYVVDAKLIATGHTDGTKVNYLSGIKRIAAPGRHWKRDVTESDTQRDPFEAAKAKKGPPPPPPPFAPAVMLNPAVTDPDVTNPDAVAAALPAGVIPPDDPWAIPGVDAMRPVPLPPFPLPSDTASVDSLILVIRSRLLTMYRKIRATYER